MRWLLLLCALAGVSRADNTIGEPAGGEPILRAVLAPGAETDQVIVRELEWVAPGGKLLWKRPLSDAPIAPGQAAPRKSSRYLILSAALPRRDSVVLPLLDQLLVLDRRDGHTLFDLHKSVNGFGELSFAEASVTVECDGKRVTRPAHGGRFLVDCGSRLVWDNGPGILVLTTAPWKLVDSMMFPDVVHGTHFEVGGAKIDVTITRVPPP